MQKQSGKFNKPNLAEYEKCVQKILMKCFIPDRPSNKISK